MQKPTPNELPSLVAPVAEHMQAATALIEGRRSPVFNHQKAVAESLHALSWMVYAGPNCGRKLSFPSQQVPDPTVSCWLSAQTSVSELINQSSSGSSCAISGDFARNSLIGSHLEPYS